ncbi:hypothetical protein B4900_11470 [Yersinia rohdei]|uniref:Uncharacterized protein n=1 Tax=Yersinia rohdei TaxID=29485 RepID=A0A0U1HX06_YERRO|nr:hypothetical protein [Yersinia rohdei]OWF79035.1 hypothetical protein B4900_11470 [Yersinia rohdei]CQI96029.1 Uncharacterised protein [Yersinia rohdei]
MDKPSLEMQLRIKELLEKYPSFIFQQINSRLNKDGLMLSIRTIEENQQLTGADITMSNSVPCGKNLKSNLQ